MNLKKIVDIRVGVLAYTDNTTWLTNSQESMQRTIDIAQEFYKLNDIEINLNKTELIVLKHGKKKHAKDYIIWIGDTRIKIIAKDLKETTSS